ncbi:MAG TPA: GAF domain-containing protein [Gemmataceae bacterium]|nr:GAF domain-containing protein [Gemmataceae bacterium]
MTTPSQIGPNGAGPDEHLQRAELVIGALDKGIAVLGADFKVWWANQAFRKWCAGDPIGKRFFDALDTPGDARPTDDAFHAALAGSPAFVRIRQVNNTFLDVTISPVRENDQVVELVALCEDVTATCIRQQKLNALYKAGQDLDALDADQLAEMNVACRVELLKQNVRRYVHNLLRYNVVEVRMLEPGTGKLVPLMEEGMTAEAANRELYARTDGNGVTGFVAARGEPYLCPDTTKDPHFIEGSVGARSSMTVPIIYQDEVIGTFNVESPDPNAFGPEDLQFTELFARELARSLHTLNLLNAQEQFAALGVIDLINKEIALPADSLLAVASGLIDQLGDKPEAVTLLRRVLTDARKIKLAVKKIGGDVARPATAAADPKLDGMRILVIDADERIRRSAHVILERKGCVVETASSAAEGIAMAKAGTYDAVLVSIKHKDMGGTAAYRALVKAVPLGRVILTQGFEYDCGHTVVNVRQDGYWLPILFKPFQEPVLFKALTVPAPSAPAKPEPVVTAS